MNKTELTNILELHQAWLHGQPKGNPANLRSADLSSADLSSANLRAADLSAANLRAANLRAADLSSADLRAADLSSAKNSSLAVASTRILCDGILHVWKKCSNRVLVKLEIPASAKRSHAFGRKCRAEFADVIEVIGAKEGIGIHDPSFIYRPGDRVTAKSWCDDFTQECAGGIHFFITREEAEAFEL